MFTKLRVHKHEVGLWFRHGDFHRALTPGAYWVPGRFVGRDSVQVLSTLGAKFEHPLLEVLLEEPALAAHLRVVDLDDDERALVWKDGRLGWFLGPGKHAFWKRPFDLTVETFNVDTFVFEHRKIETVLAHPQARAFLDGVRVDTAERVLLFRDGELFAQLGPGLHVFWRGAGSIDRRVVDLREQVADVTGQEIMTQDKVTLRINLVVTWQVADAVKALTVVNDHAQALYREAQLALRDAVGARVLDKLLADKDAVGNEVRNALTRRAAEFGLTIRGVGLRDVILPGDMKVILNEVILAQKQAEANLIRRREETAAARSQANTAKLLAENPALARMKELEALQEILAGAKATFVLGQDDVAGQVRRLIAEDAKKG